VCDEERGLPLHDGDNERIPSTVPCVRPVRILLAVGALVGFSMLNSGPTNDASGSAIDTRLVALLAGHAQREADLATIASQRAPDPAVAAAATHVRDTANAHVTELLDLLQRIGIDGPTRGVLFAASVGGEDRITVGSVSYLCHLSGPVDDDLNQLRHDDAAAIDTDWPLLSQNAFSAALAFRATAGTTTPATQRILVDYEQWHRELLAALRPVLPPGS
jgi:hypothetical protein